jgi:hypothetical protein
MKNSGVAPGRESRSVSAKDTIHWHRNKLGPLKLVQRRPNTADIGSPRAANRAAERSNWPAARTEFDISPIKI